MTSTEWIKRKKEVRMKHCKYCGSTENLTVDHKQPKVKGGTNEINNLQCLCYKCNILKGDFPHGVLINLAKWFPKTKFFRKKIKKSMSII